jgi:RNA polymerase subunit RPABC4/transcription elongation factor Spt4
MNIPCPKCSQEDPTTQNHNLVIGDKQSEICPAARAGTLHGWCRIHDTLLVPNEAQSKIAASAGCENA